ncbi:UNVERIFIED_CONTAM: hypothetical protein FKN15_007538 [Acipenser sinensis]
MAPQDRKVQTFLSPTGQKGSGQKGSLSFLPGKKEGKRIPVSRSCPQKVHSPPPCSTTHPNAAHHSCISSLHPILRHVSDTTPPIQTLSVNWQRDSDASLDMVFDLRASLEKLVHECAEERKERQETMIALGEFHNQFQAFMKQWERAQGEQGRIANSLDELREETQNISTL